jgi:microsomal dipeptidase-like Zn-dependent dipeptidase
MTQEYLDELKREEGENFDPTMWPLYFEELNSPIRMQTIWDGLSGRGMKDSVLEKIMGTNLIRLYNDIYG